MSVSYTYDTEGRSKTVSEDMPAGQQRFTEMAYSYLTHPFTGAAYQTSTTVNNVLVETSLRSIDGYRSRSDSFGIISTTERTVPIDGAWTVTAIAGDGTKQLQQYTEGRLTNSSSLATDNSAIITSSFTYDPFDRILTQTDSRTGESIMGTYTESGNLLSVTDPGNRTTAFTYDVMGRTLTTDLPDTLDADGNNLTNITRTSYTDRGEVAATWGAQTNPVFRIYDSQGRMSELRTYKTLAPDTQPTAGTQGFATTTWQYQAQRGFLTAKRDAENKGANYTYTPAGRLETRTWARSSVASPSVTTYTYDAGMLTATNYSDTTPDVSQTYDNFGRVTETTNTVSKTTYAYDPASLLLDTETVSHDINQDGTPELTRVIDRKFDALRRSTGYAVGALPLGGVDQETTYQYDNSGRLAAVSGGGLNPPSQFQYNYLPSSNLLSTIVGPAHTVTNSYDPTRNVLLNKENKAGTTIVSNYAYDVNAIGQRTDVSQSGTAFATARDIAWGYDPLGQVTKADSTIPGLDRAYQYDLIGNRLKASDSLTLPATPNYTTNSLNQYTAVGANNPAYDADGNATAYPLPAHPAANSTLTWDAENRLTSATLPDSTTVTYTYDAASRRIAKATSIGTTLYLYDAWNPIAEYIGSAGVSPTLSKTYLWGMDLSGTMKGAGGVGGLLMVSEISNSQIVNYFPTYDGNGNVSDYLDSAGTPVAHYEYDPFGNTTVATGPRGQDFAHRFSTKPLDAETGLYYYGYRYYDPNTGRWPSRDPIGENGGINLYGFLGNDPANWLDILGLKECDLVISIYRDKSFMDLDARLNGAATAALNKQIEFMQKMVDKCVEHGACCCDSVKITPSYVGKGSGDLDVSLSGDSGSKLYKPLEDILSAGEGENPGDIPVYATGQMIGESVMKKRSGVSLQRDARNYLGYVPGTGGIVATPGDPGTIAHEAGHYLGYYNKTNPMEYEGKKDPHHSNTKNNIMGYDFDPTDLVNSVPDKQWCKLICDKANN